MVFSTSDVDTLNFNKFVKGFSGGTSKVASKALNNVSATSPWNIFGGEGEAAAAPKADSLFSSKNLKYLMIAAIAYYVLVPKDKKKEINASLMGDVKSVRAAVSDQVKTYDRDTSSAPASSAASSNASSTASSAPSQSKKYRYRR